MARIVNIHRVQGPNGHINLDAVTAARLVEIGVLVRYRVIQVGKSSISYYRRADGDS